MTVIDKPRATPATGDAKVPQAAPPGRVWTARVKRIFLPPSDPVVLRQGAAASNRARERGRLQSSFDRTLVAEPVPRFRPEAQELAAGARTSVVDRIRTEVSEARATTTEAEREDRSMLAVALTCCTVGICLLAFLVYAYVFTGLQEARQQRALVNQFQSPAEAKLLSGKVPPEGEPAAVLQIPALHLTQVVVEGTSAPDLLKGPGVMIGAALPGTKGNAVIAGRRSTAGSPFARLTSLRPGDRIVVATGLGKFDYRVEQLGSAEAGATDPVGPTRSGQLTLVTSNSGVFPTGRDYVIAKLVSPAATAFVPRTPPPMDQRALSGDGAYVLPSLLWGILFGLALVASFIAYRRAPGQVWSIYLLTTPILLAVALVWFANLFLLLPATL